MPVSLIKAPSVSAADSTGYVVQLPGWAHTVTVQSVQNSRHTPGYVNVRYRDLSWFGDALVPAGRALTLAQDQLPPTGPAYL